MAGIDYTLFRHIKTEIANAVSETSLATGIEHYFESNPIAAADVQTDSTHRFVTDTEKTTWAHPPQADWGESDSGSDAFIKNKPTIPVVSDLAYGSGWDGNTDAPSKNAVYDKIETLGSSGLTHSQVMSRVSMGF
jgi:hypothetical protein